MGVLEAINGTQGYFDQVFLNADELEYFREKIREQWFDRLVSLYPELGNQLKDLPMTNYHLFLAEHPEVDHVTLWPKEHRILSMSVVHQVRQMPFFKALEQEFGEVVIANESKVHEEEIYWRITRPDAPNDVGPIHADGWFWELGNGEMLDGYRRVKIWIPIFTEPGKSGFRFVPSSHTQRYPFHAVDKGGIIKPQIDVADDDLELVVYQGIPGQPILFHDELLHGGHVGGSLCRISVEWTFFIKDTRIE